jgi:tetratricopeptide (TPR) repeat protein
LGGAVPDPIEAGVSAKVNLKACAPLEDTLGCAVLKGLACAATLTIRSVESMNSLRDQNMLPGCISLVGPMILICGFLFSAEPLSAETTANVLQILKLAAESKSQYEDQRAVDLYEEVLAIQPDNRDALWNAAYLHIRLGWIDQDASGRRRHYQKAHAYAERVFRQHPDSYEAHLVMGAAKAKLAEFLSSGEKVRTARELEEHARFLLKQRSDNPDVWYLFGWWHFELARVSVTDRFFASLLFGGLPTGASTDQAIECLQKAIALKPDYCAYQHDLGVFYERIGNPSKARELYRTALSISPKAPEDVLFIEKARKRLAKLES